MYIVFEGIVGSGKTTQSKKLLKYFKDKYPSRNVIWTFEPGGSEIGNTIRKVVQGTKYNEDMDPVCEAYLYAASRAQVLKTVVSPCLKDGGIVISDRSFITSLAFQSFGRGLELNKVLEINKPAIENFIPDVILYFDLDIEIGLNRIKQDGLDRLNDDKFEAESIGFFNKIRYGYSQIAKLQMFENKWVEINANKSVDDVFEQVLSGLADYL